MKQYGLFTTRKMIFGGSSISFDRQAWKEITRQLNVASPCDDDRVYLTEPIISNMPLSGLLEALAQLIPGAGQEKNRRRKCVFLAAWDALSAILLVPTKLYSLGEGGSPGGKMYHRCLKLMFDLRESVLRDEFITHLLSEITNLTHECEQLNDPHGKDDKAKKMCRLLPYLGRLAEIYDERYVRAMARAIDKETGGDSGERILRDKLSKYIQGEDYHQKDETESAPEEKEEKPCGVIWSHHKSEGTMVYNGMVVDIEEKSDLIPVTRATAYYPSRKSAVRGVGDSGWIHTPEDPEKSRNWFYERLAVDATDAAIRNHTELSASTIYNTPNFCGSVSVDMALLLIELSLQAPNSTAEYFDIGPDKIAAYRKLENFEYYKGQENKPGTFDARAMSRQFREFILRELPPYQPKIASIHLCIRNSDPYISVSIERPSVESIHPLKISRHPEEES